MFNDISPDLTYLSLSIYLLLSTPLCILYYTYLKCIVRSNPMARQRDVVSFNLALGACHRTSDVLELLASMRPGWPGWPGWPGKV